MLGRKETKANNSLCATSKSLVPHGRGITAGPGQDGIALLGVLGQEVGQVVDGAVEGLGAKWFSRIGVDVDQCGWIRFPPKTGSPIQVRIRPNTGLPVESMVLIVGYQKCGATRQTNLKAQCPPLQKVGRTGRQ